MIRLLLLSLLALSLPAASVTVEWDANSETNIAGYRIYWGQTSRTYTRTLQTTDIQASVDLILARCVANAAYVSGTINLSGGTSATPSAAGLADKATLIGRGCTVTTN